MLVKEILRKYTLNRNVELPFLSERDFIQKTKNRTANKNGRQSIIELRRAFIHRKANKGTILRGMRGELVPKQLKFPSLRWNTSHAVVGQCGHLDQANF